MLGSKPRPNSYDQQVKDAAFEVIWPKIEKWAKQAGDIPDEETKASARTALENSYSSDGYDIAKEFESESWCPDSTLVDILDEYDSTLHQAWLKAVAEWVMANDIKPQFTLGTMVKFNNFGKEVVGEITDIYTNRAQYCVCVPELGHVKKDAPLVRGMKTLGSCVAYENCTLVETT